MKLINYIILAIVIIALTGCADPKRINLIAKPVTKPNLILPAADVLTLKKVEWILVNKENIDESFDKLKKQGRPLVFFSTSDEGYENLATNFSGIRAYLQQQDAIIEAYKNYYFESVRTIDSANDEINKANEQVEKVNSEVIEKPSMWESIKNKVSGKSEKDLIEQFNKD